MIFSTDYLSNIDIVTVSGNMTKSYFNDSYQLVRVAMCHNTL